VPERKSPEIKELLEPLLAVEDMAYDMATKPLEILGLPKPPKIPGPAGVLSAIAAGKRPEEIAKEVAAKVGIESSPRSSKKKGSSEESGWGMP